MSAGSLRRSARRTHVLPTPGSPVSRTVACASIASARSSTSAILELGSHRSSSAISFEKGGTRRPNQPRSVVFIVGLLVVIGCKLVDARRVKDHRLAWFAVARMTRRSYAPRVGNRIYEAKRIAFVLVLDLGPGRIFEVG